MPSIEKRLGNKVAEFRLAHGLTQAQLAEKVDMSVETISRLERGVTIPSLKTLEHVAKTLKTPVGQFFEFSGTSPKSQAYEQELVKLNALLRTLSHKKLSQVHKILKLVLKEI